MSTTRTEPTHRYIACCDGSHTAYQGGLVILRAAAGVRLVDTSVALRSALIETTAAGALELRNVLPHWTITREQQETRLA